MAGLPDNIKEMTKWPHTPNQRRLTAAANFYDHASQSETPLLIVDTDDMSPKDANRLVIAATDSIEVEIFLNENHWQEWATETFQKESDPLTETLESRITLIASIAAEADSEDTMGLAIMTRNSHQVKGPGKMAVGFARMFRRTDWMGLSRLLQEAADTNAIVVESRRQPGRIGHTICVPSDIITLEDKKLPPFSTIPLPGGKELTSILQYHNVTRILLNPAPRE